ncbi:hypothetical protein WJX72_000670 [[Myrmecia] bisecta]|uniref:Glutathione S-transferase n=1 Tax=[Myrmecia] bisecta TaxID=41462 RepID=A0AAW1PNX1_9CHLO
MLAGLKKAFTKDTDRPAGQAAEVSIRSLHFADNAPSWEELQQLVEAKQEEVGWHFTDPETGPTNPLSLRRTFGQPGEPRIKLYRDHAGWCPYCQKVWFQLEEKQVPYIIEKINMRCYGDKPADYLAKVPSGLLPAVEIDGHLITESMQIMRVLEEVFPERPLLPPAGSPESQRVNGLMQLERQFYGAWLQWLRNPWSHEQLKAQFIRAMDAIEEALGAVPGPYFLGEELSLIDVNFVPAVERAVASIAYYKGLVVRGSGRWPRLEAWFDALETRPAYLGLKSDFYTHCHDLPPQIGGCASVPEGAEFEAAIDGKDGKSWHLPLPPLTRTTTVEPFSPGDKPEQDRVEAAARLVRNHVNVVKFAARGCGAPGPRPVDAPLADPTAQPGVEHLDKVDAGLRHVAHALLAGVEAKQAAQQALRVGDGADGSLDGGPVRVSAAYMRDRVGVPRDMTYPAARQLRAHLNWLMDTLGGAS